jgi:hypothetical protein
MTANPPQRHATPAPLGCWHCHHSGRLPYRHGLPESFTLAEYEATPETMIPCRCRGSIEVRREAVSQAKGEPESAVLAILEARAARAIRQAGRYLTLSNERARTGPPRDLLSL